jgi:hypothetical protein
VIHVGVHHDGLKIVGPQLAVESRDLGIAKPVEGEFEGVRAAGQDEVSVAFAARSGLVPSSSCSSTAAWRR